MMGIFLDDGQRTPPFRTQPPFLVIPGAATRRPGIYDRNPRVSAWILNTPGHSLSLRDSPRQVQDDAGGWLGTLSRFAIHLVKLTITPHLRRHSGRSPLFSSFRAKRSEDPEAMMEAPGRRPKILSRAQDDAGGGSAASLAAPFTSSSSG